LGTCPGVEDSLPARRIKQRAIGRVRALRDGDAQPVAQRIRHFAHHGGIPAADEHRGDRTYGGRKASFDTALDPSQLRLGGRDVLLARE
jgi:hypothetical protein